MDFISSFFQNVKDKLSNPFFGTLIFILIFHHWEFWYAILNFDNNLNLQQKLNYLKALATIEFSTENIFVDVAWAGLFTVIGYGIVIATRALSLWIEFNLMPKITKRVIEKNIVQRTEHEEVVKERDEYSEKYEIQRKIVREMSKSYDEQTLQIADKDKSQLKLNDTVAELQNQLNSSNLKLDKEMREHQAKSAQLSASLRNFEIQEVEINELKVKLTLLEVDLTDYKKLFFNDNDRDKILYSKSSYFPSLVQEKVSELKNNNLWSTFLSVGNYLMNGGTISAIAFKELEDIGIITHDYRGNERFSTLGNIIFAYRNAFSKSPEEDISDSIK